MHIRRKYACYATVVDCSLEGNIRSRHEEIMLKVFVDLTGTTILLAVLAAHRKQIESKLCQEIDEVNLMTTFKRLF
jgi:hypothetical protein